MSCYIYSTIFISLAPKEKQLCERKQEDHEIRHFANFLFTFPFRSFICFCYDHLLILMAVFKNISTKFTCSLYQAKLIGNHLTPISMVNWKIFRLSFSSYGTWTWSLFLHNEFIQTRVIPSQVQREFQLYNHQQHLSFQTTADKLLASSCDLS